MWRLQPSRVIVDYSVVQVSLTRGQRGHVKGVTSGDLTKSRVRSGSRSSLIHQIRDLYLHVTGSKSPCTYRIKKLCTYTVQGPKYIVHNNSFVSSLAFTLTVMSSKHCQWSWGYFFTNNLFFCNNSYYKNAWCIACLNHHKEILAV